MTQTRDGATTALQRELTALREKYDRDISDKEVGHQLEMAEARAARERAESALKQADELAREVAIANAREAATSRELLQQAESERDAALADLAFVKSQRDDNENAWGCEKQKRQAAETALASARKLLERADRYIEQQSHDYGAGLRGDIRALLWPDVGLTSHPAPVAAQSLEQGLIGALLRLLDRYEGCPAEDYADAWWTARSLLRGHREQLALAGTAPVAAPCAGCALLLRRLRELTEYYMLEVRNSEDRLKRVHRLQAQLARVGTRLHVKRAEAAHWMRAADASHHTKRVTVNALLVNQRALRANYDACHRQHEQCMKLLARSRTFLAGMKLLARSRTFLAGIEPLASLVDDMLLKGELPEGWDDK